ncbi:MAG: DNA polymerase III subunit alpha [Luteolibacter sp.]
MELLVKSSFSFLRGSSPPEALITRAAELGHKHLGLVDHMGFYGSARAHQTAKKHGIRAIVGATVENFPFPETSIPLIAKNRTGYQNLSRLLTCLHLKQTTPHDLTGIHAILTPESFQTFTKAELLKTATHLKNTFGSQNLSLAIFRHHRRGEEKQNTLIRDLAAHLRLPVLASHSPLYATHRDRLLTDAFTCLREHRTLDDAGRLLEQNGERHLKSPRQLHELFSDHPAAIRHSYDLCSSCEFSLENLGYRFPSFSHESTGIRMTAEEQNQHLRQLAYQGLERIFGKADPTYRAHMDKELAMVAHLGFAGYFLIVWDLVRFARSRDILCQGRGSAANSLLCYTLGITNVDPVAGGLLFERFLSENRTSWPDIDIDFPSGERRESVIQYVYEKYAPRGAAMTANVITYRPRSAFREMSKILGFPESVANRFTDLCTSPKVHDATKDHFEEKISSTDHSAPSTRHSAIGGTELSMDNYYPKDQVLEFAKTVEKSGIPASHPRFEPLLKLYHAILGSPRHLGQHSGGMVFCDDGLDHIVPLQPATMPGRTVLQWDKDDCEELGIVKVDLLGLGMLAAMEDTIRICRQRGKTIDLATLPKDDPATYAMLCEADTIGTFQVESRAQMATLPIMKPKVFYDLAIEVAIIRPGPIVGNLVHPYLSRRTGRERVDYIHPSFKPILERTLGVPLFQEQVQRMAMQIADFSGTEADELRKAMSFKKSDDRMILVSEKLRDRMSAKGISRETQHRVIESISSFALYGFPESHAISFALIAYASCWLKVHHPAEFFCGLINNQPMGFYSVNTLLQDAKHHGLRIRPVSAIHSMVETTVIADRTIRLGLHRIKGLRHATAERILEKRSEASFTSLPDFLHRVAPNKKERRLLAAIGALNELPEISHRRDALWQAELLPPDDLFAAQQSTPNQLTQMDAAERLATDFAIQSASTGPHPMKLWRENQPSKELCHSVSILNLPHGLPIEIAGLVICRQRPGTAKGHCFISLEDEHGIANLFIPRKTFHQYRLTIVSENFLLVQGRLQITEDRKPTVYVTHLKPLVNSATLPTTSHDFH